ncbi:REP-associated tyrosine transposase [Microbulbifer rhizosphaerae]|uniref:REP element-mobilizing transposase RayT n=1 Tax=Microbulbifer rhizosphaerae TaxID=1562603 RepID=A0A7W4WFF4_9GAMM|nr:transposase [Microbulbifer rhizosphaerae]MBB3063245.1 REP element-mobilizing transposase RayT [Microbulbifer rhizosphaerae]
MAEYKPGHQALRKGRFSASNQIYLATATTYERKPIFKSWDSARLACACFENRSILKNSEILSWVLMPDHAHWLIQLGENADLSELIKKMKSASALLVNKSTSASGPLWDKGFHDRALRKEEDIVAAARYLVANPLRAGLVKRVEDYPYWNAIWLR